MQLQPGRDHFLAVPEEPWHVFRLIAGWQQPDRDPQQQLQELADEAAILELIVSYVSSHDAKDLGWTLSLFSPDNDPDPNGLPRREALAQQYTMYNHLTHNFSRHRIANLVVRHFPDAGEAWLTGYWHVSRTGYPGDVTARFGHYFWRVVKLDGRWLIADRRGSGVPVFESEFAADDVPPAPPAANDASAAGDWIAEDLRLWQHKPDPDLLARLLAERQARELLAFYSYALDAQDWGWLASLFAEDASMTLSGRAFHDRSAVVAELKGWQAGVAQSTHRCSNPVLRLAAGGREAWLSASFHFSTMANDECRASTFGRYFGRLVLNDQHWRIAEWRVFAEPSVALLPATNRSRQLSMPDIPPQRDRFDAVVNSGAWSARKWLIDLPVPDDAGDARLRRLTDELQLREFLIAYAASLDSKDLQRVQAFFDDQAVVTTATGRFRYLDRIRDYLAANFRNRTPSFHRLMNTAVRLAPNGQEAWLSTYFYAARPLQRRASDGHLLGRVVRHDDTWKFVDLLISMDRARFFPAS